MGSGMSAAEASTVSIVVQIDWLASRVRELQVRDEMTGGGSGADEETKSPGSGSALGSGFDGTIEEASRQIILHIVRLQEELGQTMASLNPVGSPAWRRDRVLTSLNTHRSKLLGEGREQELAKAQMLLSKLEEMKKVLAASGVGKPRLTPEQQEEQEKAAYFAAKAQRLLEEQEAARLAEEARLKEEEHQRRKAAIEALRQPDRVEKSRRGPGANKTFAEDLDSMAQFRDNQLGIAPGGGADIGRR